MHYFSASREIYYFTWGQVSQAYQWTAWLSEEHISFWLMTWFMLAGIPWPLPLLRWSLCKAIPARSLRSKLTHFAFVVDLCCIVLMMQTSKIGHLARFRMLLQPFFSLIDHVTVTPTFLCTWVRFACGIKCLHSYFRLSVGLSASTWYNLFSSLTLI